jgi:hypothetical protein
MRSGLYFFIDGHLYFNDKIIKIRYDLLRNKSALQDFNEKDVFDDYHDVIPLE